MNAGIEPYDRGGRLAGVRYRERKYRLAILDLPEAELDHAERIWDRTLARLSDLADLLVEKTRGLSRGLGYAREMMAVLDRAPAAVLSRTLQERLRRSSASSRASGCRTARGHWSECAELLWPNWSSEVDRVPPGRQQSICAGLGLGVRLGWLMNVAYWQLVDAINVRLGGLEII